MNAHEPHMSHEDREHHEHADQEPAKPRISAEHHRQATAEFRQESEPHQFRRQMPAREIVRDAGVARRERQSMENNQTANQNP